jgi:hypothetical protein
MSPSPTITGKTTSFFHDDHTDGFIPSLMPVGHPLVAGDNRDLSDQTFVSNVDNLTAGPHTRTHSWYYKTINGNDEAGYPEISSTSHPWYHNNDPLYEGFALTDPANRTASPGADVNRKLHWVSGVKKPPTSTRTSSTATSATAPILILRSISRATRTTTILC